MSRNADYIEAKASRRAKLYAKGLRDCQKCKKALPLDDFGKCTKDDYGKTEICKSCLEKAKEARKAKLAKLPQSIGGAEVGERFGHWEKYWRSCHAEYLKRQPEGITDLDFFIIRIVNDALAKHQLYSFVDLE